MKNKIKITGQTQTIQTLTKKMLGRNRYAFVSFPKTALLALSSPNNGVLTSDFVEQIQKSFSIQDPAYMRAIPSSFVYSAEKEQELDLSFLKDDSVFFNSSTLENYYHSNEIIFNSFIEFYIKNTPFIIVSFNDKKYVSKLLSFPTAYIHVPYNNYENKLDEICTSIDAVKNESTMVVLDCPILSAGLANKIWDRFDLSILDLGKIISFSKTKSLDKVKFNDKKTYKN